MWFPFVGITLIIIGLLYFGGINKEAESVAGQIIMMTVAGLIYGYGCTIQVNCVFDNSAPQLIHTTVYNKWIEHSKSVHYHFKLNSWDSDQKLKNIEVSESTYNRYTNGDNININLKKGALHIPWFTVSN